VLRAILDNYTYSLLRKPGSYIANIDENISSVWRWEMNELGREGE
jgi:hypothetical protein